MLKRFIAVISCIAIILTAFSSISFAAEETEKQSYSDIFEKDKVIDVKITIDEADLADMRAYPRNEEYHAADITVDGITVENAGIRTKGNMTLSSVANSDSDRYSYRIKFNKYVKGQKLLGLNEMVLNSGYMDPSYMREYLHYEYLRELGMNVPETVFCNLYINDELVGLYLGIEALDSSFVEREFDDVQETGNLYKMEEGANLTYKENEDYSYADLKTGTDTERTGLKAFIKALNNMPDGEKGDIEKYLDVDSALKYIASNTVLCSYDSYNGNMCHNYYMYEDENGIFTVVPWDFNQSFGGMGEGTTVGIDTPTSGGNMDNLPLIKNLLSVPEYKERYYGYIKELMTMLEGFEERVAELKAVIEPYVQKDPTAFYSLEEFEKATTKSSEPDSAQMTPSPAENTGSNAEGENRQKDRARGGGFGTGTSIIDCIANRLENLKAQFNGEADKNTSNQSGGRGGFGGFGGGMPDSSNGDFSQKPDGEFDPDNMPQIPDGFDPSDIIPPEENNGERPQRSQGGKGGFGRNRNDESNQNSVIRVHMDGHIIDFDTEPLLEDGTTLVGYRAIMEALGAEVVWDSETQTVTAVKDSTTIKLTIGSDTAYVNDEAQTLLEAPKIVENSTMIPIRFVSEQLGMKVAWDGNTKLITITSK